MISIQKKFLFIHVPRTAGNSMQNILRQYSEDEIAIVTKSQDGVERFEVRNNKYGTTKHSTLSQYKSVLNVETYRSLFKFATIRNPWDMMISFYFMADRGVMGWNRNNFLSLVKRVPTLSHYICEDGFIEKGRHRRVMHPATADQELTKNIDFLTRFEYLNEDMKSLCERLDIPYSPLPVRNRSEHAHYANYYDDDIKEVIRQKFKEEIEWGGYQFEHA